MEFREIEYIDAMIEYQKEMCQAFSCFFDSIVERWDIVIIGGALRGAINQNYFPRDIDIIVNGTGSDEFEEMLNVKKIKFSKNRFDGYKLDFESVQVDIWFISNHFAFCKNYYDKSIENIVETTFLNYDSIAFDYKRKKLYKQHYDECLSSKTICVIGKEDYVNNNPTPNVNIARMLKIKKETGFDLSERSVKYIQHYAMHCKKKNVDVYKEIEAGYVSHYHRNMEQSILCTLGNIIK